jgi:hypothetical protein
MIPARWLSVAILMMVACGTSGSRPPPDPAPSQPPSPSQPPALAPPRPAPPSPATACASDGECDFADPCQPVRCVASSARAACGHATSPEGSCVCFEGSCAMRPPRTRISQQACHSTRDCDVDPTTARCEPGIAADAGVRPRYAGPTCRCDEGDHRCHLLWVDPIPCRTTDDCWVDETPGPHVIARPRRLRGRTFRGCVDGERVPACEAGHCTLRALTC